MDRQRLEQMFYLTQEIKKHQERIEVLESIAQGTTSVLTGLPRPSEKRDRIGEVTVKLRLCRCKQPIPLGVLK